MVGSAGQDPDGTMALSSDAEKIHKAMVTREILQQRFLDAAAGMTMGLIYPLMILDAWGDMGQAAQVNGWIETAQAFFRITCLGQLVGLSDRIGRKPVLYWMASVSVFSRMLLLVRRRDKMSVIASKLCSVAVGVQRNVAKAALADVAGSDRQQLHDINAKEQSIAGIAMAISPVVGGTLGRKFGLSAPAILSGTLHTLALIIARFRTPETLSNAPQQKVDVQQRQRSQILFGFTRLLRLGPKVALLTLALFVGEVTNSTMSIFSLFVTERFGWGPDLAGIWVTFFGLSLAAPGFLTKIMMTRLGETNTVMVAFLSHAIGTALFSMSKKGKLFWLGLVFMVPGNVKLNALETVLQASVAEMCDCGKGELLGYISSLKALASLVMPIMHARLFSYFLSPRAPVYLPSIPWIVCTASSIASIFIFRLASMTKSTAGQRRMLED